MKYFIITLQLVWGVVHWKKDNYFR
jgi:hypothetical protein